MPITDKFVLLAFADHADDSGYCFPSFRRVAWKCGISRETVKRAVRRLRSDNLLETVEIAKGKGHTPGYKVRAERGVRLTPLQFDPEGVSRRQRGVFDDVKGCRAVTPESSVESSVNRHGEIQCPKCKAYFPKAALRKHVC